MEANKLLQSLEHLKPGSLKVFASTFSALIEKRLWAQILVGMILGLILGYSLSPIGVFESYLSKYSSQISDLLIWMALPAKFF